MLRRGFALLEIIIVIGVLGAMTSLSIPSYREYQIRSDLDTAAQQTSQGLSRAQLLASSGERDSAWGFYVPAGVLYKGDSYETRDASFDETFPMPSTIAVTGLLDISYSRSKAVPSATGDITLRALNNDERIIQVTIAVDKETIATNQSDLMTICHKPGHQNSTMTIPDNAWPGHQNHGDTMGACAGASSSAVSSSAGQSSTASSASSGGAGASSSVASSSGGGGGGSSSSAGACGKFAVGANQLITLTANSTVTFTNKLAQITFGAGGPPVSVHVCHSRNNGSSYTTSFTGNGNCTGNGNAYGNAVEPDGTDTQTRSLTSGDQLVLKVRGRYSYRGWLAFNETYTSTDATGHMILLQDGASLASYPGFGNQTPLRTYLQGQGLANAQGEVTLTSCQLLLITELGTLGSSGADFQDDVLLLTFD